MWQVDPKIGINTNPEVVEAILNYLKDRYDARYLIGDSPIINTDTNKAFEQSGYKNLLKNENLQFIDLDEPLFYIGIVSTIIIAIGTCLLLLAGILTKLKNREINLLYLIGGILTTVGIITFVAGAAGVYGGFWTIYYVHVATILPFIAGGLGIAAGVIGMMEKRKA